MADLEEGVSSPEVKKIQQQINEYYQQSVVPEDGSFDKSTTEGLKRFQKDVKVRPTGVADAATMKLLAKPPKVSAHKVVWKGDELLLTDEEYKNLLKELGNAAKPIVAGFKRKVEEVRSLWDAHNKARKDTFFLIPATVDIWSGCTFPAEGVIRAAESAVAKMQSAAGGGDANALIKALKDGQPPIQTATKAMKEYRDAFFDGGESLIKTLEAVKEGCVDILEISAAIATGGASIEVTAGVMAGVGAYKSLLGEIGKASTSANFSLVDAFGNVLVDGAVAGTVGALLHNDSFVSGITEGISKKIGSKALTMFGSDVAKKVAEKAVKGGLEKALETAVKDMVESCKPGSKMTMDKAIKDITEDLVKGAAYGATCGKLDKELEAFTKNSVKYFKPGMFKGLGKIDPKKAFDKGGEQIVEAAMKRLGKKVVLDAADDPKKMGDVGDMMADAIADDPAVNKAMADLVKKNNLK